MAQFTVEIAITTKHYFTVEVEADSEEVAKKLAIDKLAHDTSHSESGCEDVGIEIVKVS